MHFFFFKRVQAEPVCISAWGLDVRAAAAWWLGGGEVRWGGADMVSWLPCWPSQLVL